MKKLQKRKGFTIVELVIVIAVISILSSILIPKFTSLITKAKIASDTQLIQNLNTSLTVYEIDNDTENVPFHNILNIIETENGINKNSITPSSNGDILYDSTNNRFLLTNKDGDVIFYDKSKSDNAPNINSHSYRFWKIYNSKNELESNTTFSIYWNTSESFPLDTISAGFDSGDNTNAINLTYTNNDSYAKSIIIRTNGGNLTINGYSDNLGNGDVVYHYGISDKIDIIKVGNNSYHEFGESLETTIHYGHYIAEAGAKTTILNVLDTVTVAPDIKQNSTISFANNKSMNMINNNSSSVIQPVLPEENQLECTHEFVLIDNFNSEVCNKCGKMIDSNHEHTYGDYISDNEKHTKTCTLCNKSITDNHSIVISPEVKPTCTTAGKTEGQICSVCNHVIKQQTDIEPTHSFSKEFTIDSAPTCRTLGIKSRHCEFCDEKIDVTYIKPDEHKYSEGTCSNLDCLYKLPNKDHTHEWICTEENKTTNTRICFCLCGEFGEFGTVSGFAKLIDGLSDTNTTITLDKNYNFSGESHNFNILFNDKITNPDTLITIDGNNFTIYNLNCVQENAGLFAAVNVNLIIKNLNIEGGEVESSLSDGGNSGAFIGLNDAATINIQNCSTKNIKVNVKDNVTGSAGGLVGISNGILSITDCSVQYITLKGKNCGGLIGKCSAETNISNCEINDIEIMSGGSYCGGVIGWSTVKNITVNNISGTNNYIKGSPTKKGLIVGNGSSTNSNCSSFILKDGKGVNIK